MTGKVADGAITLEKPNTSYEKRVTLLDDAAGNALGWNPSGDPAATTFVISEPNAVLDQSFVVANVWNPVAAPGTLPALSCFANSGTHLSVPPSFNVRCDVPPPQGAQLHYLTIRLPYCARPVIHNASSW